MARLGIYKWDFILITLLFLTLPLFLYKLGQSSLVSWDEAWYADIARNILKTGDPFRLVYNGSPFVDHPPTGFWAMAISFKLFGVSDFTARLASALAGLGTLIAVYFLGKELFNNLGSFMGKLVGFSSAVALVSASWFLYRARSGNLDIFLTLFFVLTILLAIKASKEKRYFPPFLISLILLILTKTMVPFVIIPTLVIIFWGVKIYKFKELILPLILFFVVLISWFLIEIDFKPDFISKYLMIGLPTPETPSTHLDNLKSTKEYLHNGIGKWFWPGMVGILAGAFLRKKNFLILTVFCISFLTPFLFSNRGGIWHLIPAYPFMILAFFGFLTFLLNKFTKRKWIILALTLAICFYYSAIQIRQMWYQFIDIPAYISDEAILSTEAGKYPQDLYIDGSNFGPAAAFYSQKKVNGQIWQGGLGDFFKQNENFILITHQWRLDQANISKDQYKVIKTDRDKILVIKI